VALDTRRRRRGQHGGEQDCRASRHACLQKFAHIVSSSNRACQSSLLLDTLQMTIEMRWGQGGINEEAREVPPVLIGGFICLELCWLAPEP
jgi:hypothetical protein